MSFCFSLEIQAKTMQSRQEQGKEFGSNPTQLETVFQNVLN
jgi:hypothetical protein